MTVVLAALLLLMVLFGSPAVPLAAALPFRPIALGVYVGETDAIGAQVDAFRAQTGATPAIVMWYQGFDQRLYRPAQAAAVAARGEIPEVTWDPEQDGRGIALRAIASGSYDSYISSAAALAVAWHKPMLVRFAPEMNLSSSQWGPSVNGNTAADYVAAWRHVVSVFRARGATNVQWVWSPDQNCNGRCPFQAFYPGDPWVDWVALDGYNGGPALGAPWLSLAQELLPSYSALAQMTQKPMMIGETASGEMGGNKPAWILDAFLHDIPVTMPRVRAVTWFDVNKETNWSVTSSAAALQAFAQAMRSPLYAGGGALYSSSANPPLADIASSGSSTRRRSLRSRVAAGARHRSTGRSHLSHGRSRRRSRGERVLWTLR